MTLSRRTVALTALAGAALLLLSSTLTWVTATGLGETAAVEHIDVPGSDAAETVAAMGLVGLAAGVAVTIARRFGRWMIAAVLLISALASLVSAIGAIIDPHQAAQRAVGEVTGTMMEAADYSLGVGPFAAALGAVMMGAAAVALGAVSHRWPDARAAKKYRRVSAHEEAEPDEYDLWDGLSEGEDPTDTTR